MQIVISASRLHSHLSRRMQTWLGDRHLMSPVAEVLSDFCFRHWLLTYLPKLPMFH